MRIPRQLRNGSFVSYTLKALQPPKCRTSSSVSFERRMKSFAIWLAEGPAVRFCSEIGCVRMKRSANYHQLSKVSWSKHKSFFRGTWAKHTVIVTVPLHERRMLQSVQEMMLKQSEIAALEQVSRSLVFGRHSKAYQDCKFVQFKVCTLCTFFWGPNRDAEKLCREASRAKQGNGPFQNAHDLDCFHCFHSILRSCNTWGKHQEREVCRHQVPTHCQFERGFLSKFAPIDPLVFFKCLGLSRASSLLNFSEDLLLTAKLKFAFKARLGCIVCIWGPESWIFFVSSRFCLLRWF